jgi:hypothetical protein
MVALRPNGPVGPPPVSISKEGSSNVKGDAAGGEDQAEWPFSGIHGESYRRRMNQFQEDLWRHLNRIPNLDPRVANAVLQYLLGLACQAQHIANIELGRVVLRRLPRDWVLRNIERCSTSALDLDDEWEFRRLLEVCEVLDGGLVHRVATAGPGERGCGRSGDGPGVADGVTVVTWPARDRRRPPNAARCCQPRASTPPGPEWPCPSRPAQAARTG